MESTDQDITQRRLLFIESICEDTIARRDGATLRESWGDTILR